MKEIPEGSVDLILAHERRTVVADDRGEMRQGSPLFVEQMNHSLSTQRSVHLHHQGLARAVNGASCIFFAGCDG